MIGKLTLIVAVAVAIPILTLWAIRAAVWATPSLYAATAFLERHRFSLSIAEAIYWGGMIALSFTWETREVGDVTLWMFFAAAFVDASVRAVRARPTRSSPQAV